MYSTVKTFLIKKLGGSVWRHSTLPSLIMELYKCYKFLSIGAAKPDSITKSTESTILLLDFAE